MKKQMNWYDYIIIFVIIYCISSVIEYVVHKYIMHNKFPFFDFAYKTHIEHHLNASKSHDLTLTEDDDNLCLPVDKTLYMYIFTFIVSYLLLMLYPKRISIFYIGITLAVIVLFAVLSWNTYHPIIHGLDGKKVCGIYAIPSKYIDNNSIYSSYVINNHKAHHYYKNEEKGNFNITLPFADFLFNSYKTIPTKTE